MLTFSDIPALVATFSFPWTTSEKTREKWERYLDEQDKGLRAVFIIKQKEKLVGYGTLLRSSAYEPFKAAHIPEINDVWIAPKARGQGLATLLIKHLENLSRTEGFSTIGLAVGLYVDYGPAQQLYAKLGYLPDGRGISSHNKPIVPGETYPVDDELLLWLVKTL